MQSLGGATVADLKAKDQRLRQRLEIYVGSSWIDITSLAGTNYLKSLSVQLGGAGVSAEPVAASWSATIANDDNIFHPHHPTSAYKDYFRLGRKVRISIGGNYGAGAGTDYLWQRVIGYMDVPRFFAERQELTITGSDYMARLADFALRSPSNYWGASQTSSSVETTKTFGAEKYIEDDALLCQPPGDDLDVNPVGWTTLHGVFISETETGGGSDFVGHLETSGDFDWTSSTKSFGSIVNGKVYEVSFKYKRAASAPYDSGASMTLSLHNSSTNEIVAQAAGLTTTTAWTTVKFHFTAPYSCNTYMKFWIGPSAIDSPPYITVYYIDQLTFREVTARVNTRYVLPAACNGPYYVTLDGTPYWLGDIDQGWFYDETNKIIYFGDDVWIETGTNNLIVYYYTTQAAEDVVAEILAAGPGDGGGGLGIYANKAAAKAAMDYVATGITVPRVWFKTGTKAIEAMRALCELVNYRFWFKYDGTPCFRPAPSAAAPAFEQYDNALFATSESFQELEGTYNSIIIEGIEQGMYATTEDKQSSRMTHSATDSTSIAAYLERNLSIQNNLFQDQTALEAMCDTLLAIHKDPKWYINFDASFFPAPLELGDTVAWTAWFSASISAMKWGIIRAVEIADGRVSYTVEVAPDWPGPICAQATMPVPTVVIT